MGTDLTTVTIDMPPDDALQEISETVPGLTTQETFFVYWRVVGESSINAFRKAGYAGSSWKAVETRPKIREAIASMLEKVVPDHRVTQKTVVSILMEAVDIARRKDQAGNLIEAARALGDITGVAAAAKLEIHNSTQMSVTVNHTDDRKLLNSLPKTQLERLLDIERTLPSVEILDAEYEEVPNGR